MAQIRFTNNPRRGDAVLGVLATGEQIFATHESMMAATLDTTKYEYIGPVIARHDNEVLFAYKANDSFKWSERYSYKLTGYTLDGTDRTGKLNIWTAGSSDRDTSYVISYNASSVDDFIAQLNTAFQDATNYPYLKSQDWYAQKESDNSVTLHFTFSDSHQRNNTGSEGFTLTANLLPDYPALANMRRNNGAVGGEGAISSMARALVYFRSDLNSATYNPTTNVTSIARSYPICLPGYLGTSQYSGGADRCAALRAVFGEGEKGWLNFMRSCLPVLPSDWGNMAQRNGKERTQLLAGKTWVSNTKDTPQPLCPAASYCANIATVTMPKGSFWLPTTEEIAELLDGINYNTINNRNADRVNALQYRMGGSAISNGSVLWSCLRVSAGVAWVAFGSFGFFGTFVMSGGGLAVPLSLLKLA